MLMEKGTRMREAPLTTGEVARLLGVSTDRVRQLDREGVLQAERTDSGLRLFDRKAAEALAARRKQERTKAA
jgi:excisionase family DNA binding protein